MFRMIPIALALAAANEPAPSARSEMLTRQELRGLCSGDIGQAAEFRSEASYRLLAQIARERCQMYLLGIAAAELQRGPPARCIPVGTPPSQVGEAMAAALLASPDDGGDSVVELVQATLRSRYGCP